MSDPNRCLDCGEILLDGFDGECPCCGRLNDDVTQTLEMKAQDKIAPLQSDSRKVSWEDVVRMTGSALTMLLLAIVLLVIGFTLVHLTGYYLFIIIFLLPVGTIILMAPSLTVISLMTYWLERTNNFLVELVIMSTVMTLWLTGMLGANYAVFTIAKAICDALSIKVLN